MYCTRKRDNVMPLLFIHNTLPEFRICFFEELSKKYQTKFLITHPELASNIYGADGVKNNKLDVRYVGGHLLKRLRILKNEINKSNINKIILPPADSVVEIIEGIWSLCIAKKNKKDIYTWTEKWEAPRTEQNFGKKVKNGIHRLIFKLYTKNAKRVIVYGSKAKDYMMKIGVREDKIRISYMTSLPPDSPKKVNIREKYNIPESKKIIFNLARMIPRKGLDILIDAVALLQEKHNDFVLLVGGDGPMKSIVEEKIQQYDLKNIILAGYINPTYRVEYYRQSDLFVLPSRYYKGMIDGWGLPVNEALYCLTPVVATNCEGSAFDLLDGTNGLMVEQNNSIALAQGIESMLYAKDYNYVREACIESNKKYSLEKMTEAFIKAVSEC